MPDTLRIACEVLRDTRAEIDRDHPVPSFRDLISFEERLARAAHGGEGIVSDLAFLYEHTNDVEQVWRIGLVLNHLSKLAADLHSSVMETHERLIETKE